MKRYTDQICVSTGEKYDVVVVGGGTAGACAAIASARAGASTLLIERNTYLGGTCTGGQVTPMMSNGLKSIVGCSSVNKMLKDRQEYGGDDKNGNDGWFNPELLKFTLEEMYLKNHGKLLYDTEFIDSIAEENRIKGIIVHNRSGLQRIESRQFVDCTGDANVAFASGVPCANGDDCTHENQSVTLRFMVANVDMRRLDVFLKRMGENTVLALPFLELASAWDCDTPLSRVLAKAVEDGVLQREDAVYFQGFSVPGMPGTISFNCPEIPNVSNSLSAQAITDALVKGREMIRRLFHFLQIYLDGFENSFIMSVAPMPGIRESRRIRGQYVLSADDYRNRRKFPDMIARTSYPIDIHGGGNQEFLCVNPMEPKEFMEIPFRCLVPETIENLLVAGRCLSSSFVVQSAVRIQPTCRETGEAAGIAAAYCAKQPRNVQDLDGQIVYQMMQEQL
jgi:hypothetical protein